MYVHVYTCMCVHRRVEGEGEREGEGKRGEGGRGDLTKEWAGNESLTGRCYDMWRCVPMDLAPSQCST